jgi:purine-nucleoside phosphorylase
MYEKIKQTAEYIRKETNDFKPEIAIILGSGLGSLVNELKAEYEISYKDIPNFPVSTVHGHKGALLFATLNSGKRVIVMQGRFHYYEGYDMRTEVVYPIYVMKELGVKTLVVSNAAGGMNLSYNVGDIMLIKDQINLMPSPLIGPNDDRIGPRFPDMHAAYDKELLALARSVAERRGIAVREGVYAAVTGPCFETPAEYNWLRTIGADAVGMSTVPEVIIANYLGLRIFGLSVISDVGGGEEAVEVNHEEVLAAVEKTVPVLVGLVKDVLEEIV